MEQVLAHAGEQEKEYDWLGAVESFKKALTLASETDFAKRGEFCEKSGYALFRAGLQAENSDNFREMGRQSIEEYIRAKAFYRKQNDVGQIARVLRCDAMVAYLGYWLEDSVAEKKRLVDESWRLATESLKKFEESQDAYEFGTTYNQLSLAPTIGAFFEGLFHTRRKLMVGVLGLGEQAIRLLSTARFPEELTEAYVIVSNLLSLVQRFLQDPEEQEKYEQKARVYWTKAWELSEKTALLAGEFGACDGSDEFLTIHKRALESGRKTRDHLILGRALEVLAGHVSWKAVGVEDPDENKSLLDEVVGYLEEARNNFGLILLTSPGFDPAWSEAPYSDYYTQLARFETDQLEKQHLLQKSLDVATHRLDRAKNSGYPVVIASSHHILSKSLAALAEVEPHEETRRSLLERALDHRNEVIEMGKRLEPYAYWNQGVYQNYLAEIRFGLAQLEESPEKRKNLLEEAVRSKQSCLKLCGERIGLTAQMAWIGERQFEYGNLLGSFHSFTGENESLKESAQAFDLAAEWFQKANMPSRMAECWWNAAQANDTLGEHLRAAEDFERASKSYKTAAEKIPRLKALYQEYVSYMSAWTEIERARAHHAREEYGLAKGCYEKAASVHESLKRWSYLAPNYSAWAQLESAEDLSRREQGRDAAEAFERASQLFQKGKESIQAEMGRIENADEGQMAARLVKAADQRLQYCHARIVLEQARLLERKGDHYESAENYGRASEAFEKLARAAESESTRREFKLIDTLSRAWRMMARAEDEASPEFYGEASKLFELAKELGQSEKARSLALGHSRFCRGLEAGTKFTDTGDSSLHSAASQQLESASKFYLKADFKSAAEYAKATHLLFDAYAHTDRAKKEEDHEKKTRLYMMSEKVLQAAAEAFLAAEQPAKREQVLKMLDKVQEERMLAASLTEVLHGSPIVSTTATFAAPAATREAAVGLDTFEHANVQARMIVDQRDLNVGGELSLEIELVNAGRGTAQLMKIEEVIPKDFELTERPAPYRVEGSYLNLKGKRLDPLKTEEVRLLLKPRARGSFILRPRILYLDENGKYKSHEPEPVQVTVKELGISGWIKGRQ